MNKKMLQQMVHRSVRIRPKARRVEDDGTVLQKVDDDWYTSRVDDRAITLRNQRTNHEVVLGLDNVKSFQSPNFLMLRCRITIGVPRVGHVVEPLVASEVVRPTPDEVLTQAVRDAIPSVPGWKKPEIEALLAGEDRRNEWFTRRWRDEAQNACLPTPFTGSTNPYIQIPPASLREAHRKVPEQKRSENFDPLDDWPG